VVVSVAPLDEDDRALVLGLVLDEVLAWVRGLPGTSALRALVVFDEVYGFLPPHPASPPTKRPLVALLKQARAYGVGLVLATQNPMDLDYRALSNAGLWFVGRLQTDADRARVVEGMAEATAERDGPTRAALSATIKKLAKRWFVVRDVHASRAASLAQPRHAITWMRGPLTRVELRRALAASR
jgi:DNA helicase HerA-like ATPase